MKGNASCLAVGRARLRVFATAVPWEGEAGIHTSLVVDLGVVEVLHDVLDLRHRSVPEPSQHISKREVFFTSCCVVTYILKFPPTKNWRDILADLLLLVSRCYADEV